MPSLVASDATGHKVDRALTVAVMHSRFKHVDEALRQSQQIVYDDFMPGVFRHPDQYTIRDVAYKFVGQFMFKWLLNTTPPRYDQLLTRANMARPQLMVNYQSEGTARVPGGLHH